MAKDYRKPWVYTAARKRSMALARAEHERLVKLGKMVRNRSRAGK